MGRQITVKTKALLAAGCSVRVEGQGQPGAWLKVTLPDGRYIGSYCDNCLCFDCRSLYTSGNGWMEEWLIEHNVPYAAG